MEAAMGTHIFINTIPNSLCKITSSHHIQTPFHPLWICATKNSTSPDYLKLPNIASPHRDAVKIYATRKRRANTQTDTYVVLEPGQNEEFVSEEELRAKLKGWLGNWPGKSLPPDLSRFETIDDAVTYLVKSVCELEIDGDVGSIQWYQVRLE